MQLKFYNNKMGSFQFSFLPAEGEKKSSVFIEASKLLSDGSGKCDWANKGKFSLGDTDIATIIVGMRDRVKDKDGKIVNLVHTYNDNTSYFDIKEGTNGSVAVSLKSSGGSGFIYLNQVDQFRLITLLDEALRKMYLEV